MSLQIGTLTGRLELDDAFSSQIELARQRMDSALEGAQQLSKGIVALGAAAIAAGAGIVKMAEHGSGVSDLVEQFGFLSAKIGISMPKAMKELRTGTANTVGDLKLMQMTLSVMRMGFKGTEEDLGTMAKAARVLAEGGMELETAFSMITRAVTTGQTRMLARLGINIDLKKATDELTESTKAAGGVVDDVTKKQARSAAILEGVSKFVKESATIQDDFADRTTQAKVAFENWYDELSRTVANLPSVNNAFDDIRNAITKAFGDDADKAMRNAVTVIDMIATGVGKLGVSVINSLVPVATTIKNVAQWFMDLPTPVKDTIAKFAETTATALLLAAALGSTVKVLGWVGGAFLSVVSPVKSALAMMWSFAGFITTELIPTLVRFVAQLAVADAASLSSMGAVGSLLSKIGQMPVLLGGLGAAAAGIGLGIAFTVQSQEIEKALKKMEADIARFKKNLTPEGKRELAAAAIIDPVQRATAAAINDALKVPAAPLMAGTALSMKPGAAQAADNGGIGKLSLDVAKSLVAQDKALQSLSNTVKVHTNIMAAAGNSVATVQELTSKFGELSGQKSAEAIAALKGLAEEAKALKDSGVQLNPELEGLIARFAEAKPNAGELAEEVKNLRDELSGAALQKSISNLTSAWNALTPAQKKNGDTIERMLDAYEEIRPKLRVLPPALEDLRKAEEASLKEHQKFMEGMNRFSTRVYLDQIKQGELATVSMLRKAELVPGLFSKNLGITSSEWDKYSQTMVSTAWKTEGLWSKLPAVIEGTTNAFTGAFSSMGPAMKKYRDELQAMTDATERMRDKVANIVGGIPNIFVQAFTGGGGLMGALKAIGTQLADALTGSIAEGVSKAIKDGGGISAAMKALGTGIKAAASSSAAGVAVFVLGVKAMYSWADKKLADYYALMKKREEEAKALLADWQYMKGAYEDLISQINTPIKLADPSGTPEQQIDQYRYRIRVLQDIYNKEVAIKDVEAQIKDTAEKLVDAKKQLLELQDQLIPKWDEVKAALDKYKLSLDGAGQKVQQLAMTSAFTEIINDWQLLERAGMDMDYAARGMSDRINELIAQSKRYGTEIPSNMKPALESLLKQGLLTDDNGTKLTDLTGIKFGEPVKSEADIIKEAMAEVSLTIQGLETTMGNLKGILEELKGAIETMMQSLITSSGNAATAVATQWQDPPWQHWGSPNLPTDPSVPTNPLDPYGGGNYAGGGVVYASQGFKPRGSDTVPAMLTPGERVLTVAENRDYERGRNGGTVILRIDSRTLAEVLVPAIPGVVQEYALG